MKAFRGKLVRVEYGHFAVVPPGANCFLTIAKHYFYVGYVMRLHLHFILQPFIINLSKTKTITFWFKFVYSSGCSRCLTWTRDRRASRPPAAWSRQATCQRNSSGYRRLYESQNRSPGLAWLASPVRSSQEIFSNGIRELCVGENVKRQFILKFEQKEPSYCRG